MSHRPPDEPDEPAPPGAPEGPEVTDEADAPDEPAPPDAIVGGVILAAGAGRRFGRPKQLADFRGRPLIEHALRAMAGTPAVDVAVVVLGAGAEQILGTVDFGPVIPVVCETWDEGQAASLRTGVATLCHRAQAITVTLGDQPLIGPEAITRVLRARNGRAEAVRATYADRPGHPVVFERTLFGALARLRGDRGARDLLRGADVLHVPCDDLATPEDVDTPAQLQRLAARG